MPSTIFFNRAARRLAAAVLEGEDPKDFLTRHNLRRVRLIDIKPDASNPGYYNIPVFGYANGRFANIFRATENPKPDLKERLQHLVLNRKGSYKPGDIFVSPWGRFLVTDVMGLKEI